MTVTPASREAWMVAMAWRRSGRPSIERGISPSPMALTVRSPMGRCCMGTSWSASPRRFDPTGDPPPDLPSADLLRHHVELNAVHERVVRDRAGVGGASPQRLTVGLTGALHVGRR